MESFNNRATSQQLLDGYRLLESQGALSQDDLEVVGLLSDLVENSKTKRGAYLLNFKYMTQDFYKESKAGGYGIQFDLAIVDKKTGVIEGLFLDQQFTLADYGFTAAVEAGKIEEVRYSSDLVDPALLGGETEPKLFLAERVFYLGVEEGFDLSLENVKATLEDLFKTDQENFAPLNYYVVPQESLKVGGNINDVLPTKVTSTAGLLLEESRAVHDRFLVAQHYMIAPLGHAYLGVFHYPQPEEELVVEQYKGVVGTHRFHTFGKITYTDNDNIVPA